MTAPTGARERGRPGAAGPLRAALVVLALGVLAALLAAAGTWFRPRTSGAVLGAPATVLHGRDVVPAAVPLALVAVAGAVAVLASRPRAVRLLSAAVVVLAGLGLVALALRAELGASRAVADALTSRGRPAVVADAGSTGLGWLAVAAGLLLAGSGALVARAPRRRLASARYEVPGTPSAAQDRGPLSEWDAVERGVDPTAASAAPPAAATPGPTSAAPAPAGPAAPGEGRPGGPDEARGAVEDGPPHDQPG